MERLRNIFIAVAIMVITGCTNGNGDGDRTEVISSGSVCVESPNFQKGEMATFSVTDETTRDIQILVQDIDPYLFVVKDLGTGAESTLILTYDNCRALVSREIMWFEQILLLGESVPILSGEAAKSSSPSTTLDVEIPTGLEEHAIESCEPILYTRNGSAVAANACTTIFNTANSVREIRRYVSEDVADQFGDGTLLYEEYLDGALNKSIYLFLK